MDITPAGCTVCLGLVGGKVGIYYHRVQIPVLVMVLVHSLAMVLVRSLVHTSKAGQAVFTVPVLTPIRSLSGDKDVSRKDCRLV